MKSTVMITVIAFLIIAGIILLLQAYGGPIFPKSSDLTCRDKNTGNFITIDNDCESASDCQKLLDTYCGPENSCNNVRIECQKNKCIEVEYFKLDRKCV